MIYDFINKTAVSAGIFMMMTLPQFNAKKIANVYPLPKSYYNEKKLAVDLKAWATENPRLVKLHTIGYSQAGKKPIYALQIQNDLAREPVLITGQVHGDEVMGIEIAMAFAGKLIHQPQDTEVRNVLAKYAFWIVPTLNPDGWSIVTSGKSEWKRKNNNDTNKNGKLNVKTDGVDINRNFPTFWHLDKGQPQDGYYYKGTAPASEAETKAMLELAAMVKFKYAFIYHTSVTGDFSEKIFLPWQNSSTNGKAKEYAAMRELAETYAAAVPKDYQPGTYQVHPNNTSKVGNARNYLFHEWGTFAYDIETCGINNKGKSIVHPPALMRDKIVQKNMAALFHTLQVH